MKIMWFTCNECNGFGYTRTKITPNDDMTVNVEKNVCDKCHGTGVEEFAVFSIEEAREILKHCGMSKVEG